MYEEIDLNPNRIVHFLNKPAKDFTKKDLINFIVKNDIKMVNFRYIGGDGKLKCLNFIINNIAHLDKILSIGERVDGSSLFPYIDASSSDLYVVPRFRTAFLSPFYSIPSVDILCSFYNNEGFPLASAPENIVLKAHNCLKEQTGMTLEALGELEYYVFSEADSIYPIIPQKGYQSSHPFSKWEFIRIEAMKTISEMGGQIKYGHSEVGNIMVEDEGPIRQYVQHEIEFLPQPLEDAADQIVIAKWVLREIAYKYGLEISFAPKIIVGHAGSGLHIHSRLVKDGVNMIADQHGLNDNGKKLIAGYLSMSKSLSAFGNTVPTSFLRLVPHQEAPTNICWGDRNRSVLVRVPLGWIGVDHMMENANPCETDEPPKVMNNQTVELRSPDGSANVHHLLAGMAVAARKGLESKNSLENAEKLYVDLDVHRTKGKNLDQIPGSCFEAAKALENDRTVYEEYKIFPAGTIDNTIKTLKDFQDDNFSEKLYGKDKELKEEVKKYIHCG
ncbi:MAG: glutamine synthetase family protein [Spirochaetes bacterium]|nr:glutamine synthetase family protein [Spirochaetota bacterium]